jgi:two-component system OmpR family sensor kinase
VDGRQGVVNRSLRWRIGKGLVVLTVGVAVVAAASGWGLFFWHELHEQDEHLRIANAEVEVEREEVAGRAEDGRHARGPYPEEIRIVHRPVPGTAPLPTDSVLRSWDLPEGISNVKEGRSAWRVAVKTVDADTRVVVAQRMGARNRIAIERATHALGDLAPLLLVVPLFLLLVGPLVDGAFRPLARIADGLDGRPIDDLASVPLAGIPLEVEPFAVAINRLLERVGNSMTQQRRFVADAAHELRTPLAALSLQAERLGAAELPGEARRRLEEMEGGIRRLRRLVEQLLDQARSQVPTDGNVTFRSVREAVRRAFEDMVPVAEARRIDLGITAEGDILVACREGDLDMLVRNLVENAVRHIPEGGRVDVSIHSDGASTLLVEDDGPGIAPEDRERVFEPFRSLPGVESPGSGLGLSIAKAVAGRLGARVSLESRDHGASGLRVRVEFPPPADPGGISRTG